MASMAPFNAVMSRIPPEIFFEIGSYLDGLSLVSALQVSRDWHENLRSLVWSVISTRQWFHPRFPIQRRNCTKTYVRSLQAQFTRVRHLEVPCFSQNRTSVKLPQSYQSLNADGLRLVFQHTSGLQSLSLHSNSLHPTPIASALEELQTLRRLDIRLTYPAKEKVKVKDLSPWLSNLEELSLSGCWYEYNADDFKEPLSQDETPWRLKKLTVQSDDLLLVRFCPDLREIEIRHRVAHINEPCSVRPLLACPKLEALTLAPWRGNHSNADDFVETVVSLISLKKLVYPVYSPKHVEFLVSTSVPLSPNGASKSERVSETAHEEEQSSTSLVLPALEHFEVLESSICSWDRASVSRLMSSVLRTRPQLKAFVARRDEFSPWDIFARPGSGDDEWICRSLEVLCVHLRNDSRLWPEEKQAQLKEAVIHQLAQLPELETLKTTTNCLRPCLEPGIERLHMHKLRSLILMDSNADRWQKSELDALMTIMPNLSHLSLGRVNNALQIENWLKDSEVPIEFNATSAYPGSSRIACI